ncbi:Mobile element protein [Bacteroides ovatus]|nr:Mobile element protein [Bacteroides ovatus]
MTDDFYKEFVLQQEKYMIEEKKTKHRNKPNRMSDAKIMVILILFYSFYIELTLFIISGLVIFIQLLLLNH